MQEREVLNNVKKVVDSGASTLGPELEEYDNSILKQSEKELLLILNITGEPTYYCKECGEEVYPTFPSPMAWCTKCNKSTLWRKDSHWVENLIFEDLTKLTFNKAKDAIAEMSLKKRIQMLKELDRKLVYLYECTKGYNDQMFGKSMQPKVFLGIMGKIKHLEILQNWLYGIE